jgi:hypothetical protein
MFDIQLGRCVRMTQPSYPNEAPSNRFQTTARLPRIVRIFNLLEHTESHGRSQAISEGACPEFIPVPDDGCPELMPPDDGCPELKLMPDDGCPELMAPN